MPSLTTFKNGFFDRLAVAAKLPPAKKKVLGQFGGYVRKVAQNSLKQMPFGVSAPVGHAPYAHGPRFPASILYAFDTDSESVVIGPYDFKGVTPTAPELLEFGGQTVKKGKVVSYAERPFMAPAANKSLLKFAQKFEDILR